MAFNPYDPRLASTVQQAGPMMTGIMGGSTPSWGSSTLPGSQKLFEVAQGRMGAETPTQVPLNQPNPSSPLPWNPNAGQPPGPPIWTGGVTGTAPQPPWWPPSSGDPHAGMTLKPGESGNEASDWVPSAGGTQNPWGRIPQMPQGPYGGPGGWNDWPVLPRPPGFDPAKAAQDAQTKSPWVLPGNLQMFNQAQGRGVPGSMQQAQYGIGLMPPRSGRMVRIKLPNGMEQNVPEEHAAYYQSQGATLSGY